MLSLDTGHARDYSGGAYAEYFESDELMFPVWKRGGALEPKDSVYMVDLGERGRAYPLEILESSPLLHDEIGGVPILLVTDGEHGTVRCYRTGRHRVSADERDHLVDQDGLEFELTESALVSREGSIRLERAPGHLAYWFGLYAQYPDLELYTGR